MINFLSKVELWVNLCTGKHSAEKIQFVCLSPNALENLQNWRKGWMGAVYI